MGRLTERIARTSPRTRAVVMSFLLPGLGQAYVGRTGRAFIWICGIIAVGVALDRQNQRWIVALFGLALSVFAAIDAAIVAPGRPPPVEPPAG